LFETALAGDERTVATIEERFAAAARTLEAAVDAIIGSPR
jgi:hypothetical protein